MTPFSNAVAALVGSTILAGCIGGTSESTFGKAIAAECGVVTMDRAGGQDILGRLKSSVPLEGSYDLTVLSRDGSGNMTTIRQGGGFAAEAGEDVTLGAVRVSGDEAVATMVVTLARGGVLACDG